MTAVYAPIIVDKNNYIVNGHRRYDVARELEMERVKVTQVDANRRFNRLLQLQS